MSLVRDVIHELFGLFVDDGPLAAAIFGVVVLAVLFAGVDAPPPVTGSVLIVGSLIALSWSVFRQNER